MCFMTPGPGRHISYFYIHTPHHSTEESGGVASFRAGQNMRLESGGISKPGIIKLKQLNMIGAHSFQDISKDEHYFAFFGE